MESPILVTTLKEQDIPDVLSRFDAQNAMIWQWQILSTSTGQLPSFGVSSFCLSSALDAAVSASIPAKMWSIFVANADKMQELANPRSADPSKYISHNVLYFNAAPHLPDTKIITLLNFFPVFSWPCTINSKVIDKHSLTCLYFMLSQVNSILIK